jgi:GNAT superfamily N-acetyltransferase
VQPAERAERDALRMVAAVPGMEGLDVGEAASLVIRELRNDPLVNHTVGLGEDGPVDDAALDAIHDFYAAHGARHHIAVTPSAAATDLRERLEARAYTRGYAWMKFIRPAHDVPEAHTTLDVRLVDVDDDGGDFASVVVTGFELPADVAPTLAAVPAVDGCFAYVAYEGDAPAASGAVFVSGDVGWLGYAATRPEHRRKGGQGAILAARIAKARELGVHTLVTETGVTVEGRPNNSYRNILRSGFEEAYVRENYVSPIAAS